MSVYISRGVVHPGSPIDHLAGWSERDKELVARSILELVKVLIPAEPTSTGYLDPSMRDYVMKRSA